MFFEIFDKRYELSESRLAICKTCDEYDSKWKKCRKCGCFMEFKTLLPSAECPLKKWTKIDHENKQ